MPIFQRKQLRRDLSQQINDLLLSTTSSSFGSYHIIDRKQADVTFSDAGLWARAWLRLFPSTNVQTGSDLRVATFNAGTGAFVSVQADGSLVPSGAEYEVHQMLSPADKDRAINEAILTMFTRQECGINPTDRLQFLSLIHI